MSSTNQASSISAIFWFRRDLRLTDNPGLTAALEYSKQQGGQLLLLYIDDIKHVGKDRVGAASRWWLHHSLQSLQTSVASQLLLLQGDPLSLLADLIEHTSASAIFWNRCYEPWQIKRDRQIKSDFKQQGIECNSFNGSLLWEPWQVLKQDQTPYKVFTPFYRKGCLNQSPPRLPLAAPEKLQLADIKSFNGLALPELQLLPDIDWAEPLEQAWANNSSIAIGEEAAKDRMQQFLKFGLSDYKEGRNYPAKANVSRLSAHLHFGEISPNQVWYAAEHFGLESNLQKNLDHFHSELGWREFSYYLLFHFPSLATENFQKKFDGFNWQDNSQWLVAWQKGQTGIPIVDAGMRELWQTGYMHNRVRMIVGSFLVKNLLIHWQHGQQWFNDCLVDADLANNSASWQWVAGSGADAAPYFRIFNPVTQAEKFDPDGEYIRQYVPEIAALPNKYLYHPSEAPASILQQADIQLGVDYPKAIVDLKASRALALERFKEIKVENS